jgi:hypothetical protein
MTLKLKRALAAAAVVAIAAPFGALHALAPTDPGVSADEPKDCKMKPEDPRCKDDKKY